MCVDDIAETSSFELAGVRVREKVAQYGRTRKCVDIGGKIMAETVADSNANDVRERRHVFGDTFEPVGNQVTVSRRQRTTRNAAVGRA